MFVVIKKGISWNKGMEGKIFPVLSEEQFSKATNMKYPTAVYPVLHSIQDDGSIGVKVLKKENVELIEGEFLMEMERTNKLSQDDAFKTYEIAAKLAKAAGTTTDAIMEFVRNIHYIYKDSVPSDNYVAKISERGMVVEFAKQFIEDLKCQGKMAGYSWEYKQLRNKTIGILSAYNAQFIVNEEKRVVVCLLRSCIDGQVVHRGIARASEEDCFNSHIGKAISLAKALKKPIPDEFINSPQPEGIEGGDVVKYGRFDAGRKYIIRKRISDVSFELNSWPDNKELAGIYSGPQKVIDDSARY